MTLNLDDEAGELQDLLRGAREMTPTKLRNLVNKERTKFNRYLDDVWNLANVCPMTEENKAFLIDTYVRLSRKRKEYDAFLDDDFRRVLADRGGATHDQDDVFGVAFMPTVDTLPTLTTMEGEVTIWGPGADESPVIKLPDDVSLGSASPMHVPVDSLAAMRISPVPSRGSAASPHPSQRPMTPINLEVPAAGHHYHRQHQRRGHAYAHAYTQHPQQLMPKLVDVSRTPTPTMMAGAPMMATPAGRPQSPMHGQAGQPVYHLHPQMHPAQQSVHHHGRMLMHGMAGAPNHTSMVPVQRRKILLRPDGKSPEQRDHFKVFVGGFAPTTTAEQFLESLDRLGITPTPAKIKIMFQHPHRHGFVQCLSLRTIEDADRLIRLSPLKIDCQTNPLEIKPYLSRRQYRRANQNFKQQQARFRAQAHAQTQAFVRQASG